MSGTFYFTAEWRAWAAGFFDGEGCTSLNKHREPFQPTLQLSVVQTGNREELDRFQTIMGGGKVYGPNRPPSLPDHWAASYRYSVTGAKAFGVLFAMWPWLGTTKKEQALTALSEIHRLGYKGRER